MLIDRLRRDRERKKLRKFNRLLTTRCVCAGPYKRGELNLHGQRIKPCATGVVPKYAWDVGGKLVCDSCEKTFPDTVLRKRFYYADSAPDEQDTGETLVSEAATNGEIV